MVQLSKETLDALSKFFEPKQVQWKPQTTNREKTKALATAYIDARDVMNRLDRVVGGDWQFTWDLMPDGEVRGMLTVCGVTRSDVGERGDGSFGNTLKAAVSDALKRSAVHFGVGRYLYYLPGQWVGYDQQRKCLTETPRLPAWALPGSEPKIAGEAGPAVAAEELAMPNDGDQYERGRTQGQPPSEANDTTNGNGDKPKPTHWIDSVDAQGRPIRNRFWAYTGELGLTNDQVHTALGVESVKDYQGSMADARKTIDAWVSEQVEQGEMTEAQAVGL
jgi:hypothetical protein